MNLDDIPLSTRSEQVRPSPRLVPIEKRIEQSARVTAANAINRAMVLYKRGGIKGWRELADQSGISLPPAFAAGSVPFTYEKLIEACEWTKLTAAASTHVPNDAATSARTLTGSDYRALAKASDEHTLTVGTFTLSKQQTMAALSIRKLMEAWHDDTEMSPSGALIPLGMGLGKTFIAGHLIEWALKRDKWHNPMPFMRVLYLTKAAAILTARADLTAMGIPIGPQVMLEAHSSLTAAKMQAFFQQEETVDLYGVKVKRPIYQGFTPYLVIIDECHHFKKQFSKKTARLDAMARACGGKCFYLFMSGTPADTIDHLRSFTLAARVRHAGQLITEHNWKSKVMTIARAHPEAKNQEGLVRFQEFLGPLVVRPPADKRKFRSINKIVVIPFPYGTKDADYYRLTEKRYIEQKIRCHEEPSERGTLAAMFTLLRQSEEKMKTPFIVDMAVQREKEGYAPVIFCSFQDGVRDVVILLIQKYGYKRDEICVQWGGGKPIPKKYIVSDKELADLYMPMFKWSQACMSAALERKPKPPCPLSIEDQRKYKYTLAHIREQKKLDLTPEQQEERNRLLMEYKLFSQSHEQRFQENQDFQYGRRRICVVTMGAGAESINLDHQRKEARPRWVYTNITYYAVELLQALGRCQRKFTLSNTHQEMVFFADTIAALHVAPLVDATMRRIMSLCQGKNVDFCTVLENKCSMADIGAHSTIKTRDDGSVLAEEPEDVEISAEDMEDNDDGEEDEEE